MIMASVYIAAFEVLKISIIDRIKNFYTFGFDENGEIVEPDYQSKVLVKDKSVLYTSLKWLKESEAISDDDIDKFNQAKEYRNLIAHEIARLFMDGLPSDLPERFNDMVLLLDKIERWWIVNYEIPLNPELTDKDIIEDEIIPGPIASLQMMVKVALGSDEEANYFINELKKAWMEHH